MPGLIRGAGEGVSRAGGAVDGQHAVIAERPEHVNGYLAAAGSQVQPGVQERLVIRLIDDDGVPHDLCAPVVHVRQRGAVPEGTLLNGRHAGGDGDRGDGGVGKGICVDGLHLVGNRQVAVEPGTAESIVADAPQGSRQADLVQRAAAHKGEVPNALRGRDGDRTQVIAAVEGVGPDGDGGGQGHGLQRGAVPEGAFADGLQGGHDHAVQQDAAAEGFFAHGGAGIEIGVGHAGAAVEGPVADGEDAGTAHQTHGGAALKGRDADGADRIMDTRRVQAGAAVAALVRDRGRAGGELDAAEPGAASEGGGADAVDAVRQVDVLQLGAAPEGVLADDPQRIIQAHLGQGGTAIEGVFADLRDTDADLHPRDLSDIGAPGYVRRVVPVVHAAVACDRQACAVVSPYHADTACACVQGQIMLRGVLDGRIAVFDVDAQEGGLGAVVIHVRQTGAAVGGLNVDHRNRCGQIECRQTAAAGEGAAADGGDPGADLHRLDLAPVGSPGRSAAGAVVVHGAAAGDEQGVAVDAPLQIVPAHMVGIIFHQHQLGVQQRIVSDGADVLLHPRPAGQLPVEVHRGQKVAAGKGVRADHDERSGKLDLGQAGTSGESAAPDVLDPGAQGRVLQSGAALEGIGADAGHTAGGDKAV